VPIRGGTPRSVEQFVELFTGGVSEYELATFGVRAVPRPLWDLAKRTADNAGADASLALAVMVVENLQRPPWFRRLERLKGFIFKRGTYGIMQVAAPQPITDEESIIRAVRERLTGVSVRSQSGEVDWDLLDAFARTYNPNPNFSALLRSAISAIEDTSERSQ
jgi:hypothetical protein